MSARHPRIYRGQMSFVEDRPVRTSVTRAEAEGGGATEPERASGESSSGSLESFAPDGSWSNWSTAQPGCSGCPSCGAPCTGSGMPVCLFGCEPVTSEHPSAVPASSWLARPTRKANQLAPYMRRWPGCRRLQELVGATGGSPRPELWEWLMGFPLSYSEFEPWETPLFPLAPESSGRSCAGSKNPTDR